ncbi:aminoglycoside phosphotransferase family protein [Halomonas sp. SSL-5]|uniref:phosphotransferase n=1 Tax=Halomonas sp. SSL-5 TaxID=3065855 RepID=UPI002738B9FF|nr:phosphotransferase [Halomonas sp. SSL-5]MDY7115037.1 aminoglycoside phosphotransferase family protein [Halomonas sp. SSL-5]
MTPTRHACPEHAQVSCDPTLAEALSRALAETGHDRRVSALRPMADTGLAHHHLWLERHGEDWVARLPKQSQMDLAPGENLDYQAACFTRAAAGGHAPALHGVLPPSATLPRGGLLVEAVRGRPARLPEDLPAIAEALAALHALPLPEPASRPPLLAPADPWRAMRDEVAAQAEHLDDAGLSPAVIAALREELAALPARLGDDAMAEPRLISFDAHPGNFLVRDDGRAVLVDLEKCRYGLPGFDLAHASLYTSTTWDPASHAVLELPALADFHRRWMARTGLHSVDTLLSCRRAMWLWSLTWCAKWRARQSRARDARTRGEDWSAELSDASLIAHVRDRVDHYLTLATIDHVRREFDALDHALKKDA